MYTKPLRKVSKQDAGAAGGKGANLGELIRAGLPVPGGFVVLTRAFKRFLAEADLNPEIEAILDSANPRRIHTVERAAAEIEPLVLAAEIPNAIAAEVKERFAGMGAKAVAVRSSASAEDGGESAWAGQLESYLATSGKDLLVNVQRCWASLFNPRAIFYRLERNAPADVGVAVVIQRMVPAEVSGICFTAHPITGDRRQMVIEAVYGLGEALARGSMTPDTYVVRKDSATILDANVSPQVRMSSMTPRGVAVVAVPSARRARQKLTGRNVVALARLCRRVEAHFRKPQDIEWALVRGKFFILQSRPITTLHTG